VYQSAEEAISSLGSKLSGILRANSYVGSMHRNYGQVECM